MKEIKFRAWCVNKNKMMDSKKLKEIFLKTQWVLGTPTELQTDNGLYLPFYNDIYMQYTGLKDKNGKEIYEGDIVLLDEMGKAIVEYRTDICGFIVHDRAKTWASTFLDLMQCKAELTVIGNVHENLELLE